LSPEQKAVAFLLAVLVMASWSWRYVRDNVLFWRGAEEIAPPKAEPGIMVQVSGAVNAPGVYTLPRGSRVKDAIDMAQGAAPDADVECLNLASLLQDGQRLHVPVKQPPSGEPSADTRVNINTASQHELETLPGIGPEMAKRIIEYRKTSGGFATVDDLTNVSGIGDKVLARLKPLVKLR
jgi:competence protein ComEA